MKIRRLKALFRGNICFILNRKVKNKTWKIFIEKFFMLEMGKKSKFILKGGKVNIGNNCRISVRDNAELSFGTGIFINDGCQIICRQKITIGNNVQLGQRVMIFDHDHDFRVPGGILEDRFKCSEVVIGNNVWIGANSIILRGTVIGDNCVIGAGSIIKGHYEENSLIVQKRVDQISAIDRRRV